MKKSKNSGITLVALVMTIIILLILAGVAITALTQTGLFENAKQAKNAMENAQNVESVTLGNYENKILESMTRENTSTNANNQYSTTEQLIGTWIDGKNLYQKSFVMDSSYTSEVVINSSSGHFVKGITDEYMSTVQPTLDKIIQMILQNNGGTNVNYQYPLSINYSNGKIRPYDNYNVGYINYALYPGCVFTIQYTKTID